MTQAVAPIDPANLSRLQALLTRTKATHDQLAGRGAASTALTQIRRSIAQIHLKLGQHYLATQQVGKALPELVEASALDGADAGIHALLGQVHLNAGSPADAVQSFRRALALRPADRNLLAALPNALAVSGNLAEALPAYRHALAADPDNHDLLWRYAAICNDAGAFDEARTAFLQLTESQPGRGLFHRLFGKLHLYVADDPHIATMERLLAGIPQDGDDAREFHFALFNAHEGLGDYDRAFGHLKAANDIRQAQLGYRPEVHNRLLQAIEIAFDPRHPPALGRSPRVERPIFIVGMPRCGSTLVEQILDSHPDASAAGETPAFGALVEKYLLQADLSYDLRPVETPASLQAFGQAYLEEVARTADITRRTVDKYLTNFLSLGIIKAVFPEARIVHCHRNPLANCFSAYANHFETTGLGFKASMEETARYYVRYHALMQFWKKLYGDDILDFAYEDLTLDQEAETRRLLGHCGLDWNSACLDFHRNDRAVKTASYMQVRQPIYSGTDRRTGRYIGHLQPMIRILQEAGLHPA